MKLISICQIGISCIELGMLPPDMMQKLDNILLRAKSASILNKTGIEPIKDIPNLKPIEILTSMAFKKPFNASDIIKCINDFSLEPQNTLIELLKNLLHTWNPDIPEGETQLYAISNNLVDMIENKMQSALVDMLHNVWKQINYYYYEVFLCIFKLFNVIGVELKDGSNNMYYLKFLKEYSRIMPPQQIEKELWASRFQMNSVQLDELPKVAMNRLPFG